MNGLAMKSSFAFLVYLNLTWNMIGCVQADEPTSFRFVFGNVLVQPGEKQVLPETVYSKERGYGFEPGFALRVIEPGEGSIS